MKKKRGSVKSKAGQWNSLNWRSKKKKNKKMKTVEGVYEVSSRITWTYRDSTRR